MRVAVVSDDTGRIETVCDDPSPDWTPSTGFHVIDMQDGEEHIGTGWTRSGDGKSWEPPFVPEEPEAVVTLGQLIDVAVFLGTVDPAELVAILPFDVRDVLTDLDGSKVLPAVKAVGDVIQEAIDEGKIQPGVEIDIPALDEPITPEDTKDATGPVDATGAVDAGLAEAAVADGAVGPR